MAEHAGETFVWHVAPPFPAKTRHQRQAEWLELCNDVWEVMNAAGLDMSLFRVELSTKHYTYNGVTHDHVAFLKGFQNWNDPFVKQNPLWVGNLDKCLGCPHPIDVFLDGGLSPDVLVFSCGAFSNRRPHNAIYGRLRK